MLLNYLMLLLMLIFLMLLFISNIQPMFMVGILISITFVYSYVLYNMLSGFWFSYALVMVMLSGIMVIFTYFASLMANESFENYNMIYIFFTVILMMSSYKYMCMESLSVVSLELWFSYILIFNLFLVSFLLSIMVMVMWLSMMDLGALRIYLYAWLKG